MIVKDESRVIARCLHYARPLIGRWVIVDTGSTDDTEAESRRALDGIPGEYIHRPWSGFGDARTAALEAARGDYALVLDADEVVDGTIPADLDADAYGVWLTLGGVTYRQLRLFRLACRWRYVGVLHEYPTAERWETEGDLALTIRSSRDGARSADPEKYRRDAETLQRALIDDPANARYVFYLAQSWRDAGEHARAASCYQLRAAMGAGTNAEEVYIAHLEAGRALRRLGRLNDARISFEAAHGHNRQRPEALRELASLYAAMAAVTPPTGTLFVESGP